MDFEFGEAFGEGAQCAGDAVGAVEGGVEAHGALVEVFVVGVGADGPVE